MQQGGFSRRAGSQRSYGYKRIRDRRRRGGAVRPGLYYRGGFRKGFCRPAGKRAFGGPRLRRVLHRQKLRTGRTGKSNADGSASQKRRYRPGRGIRNRRNERYGRKTRQCPHRQKIRPARRIEQQTNRHNRQKNLGQRLHRGLRCRQRRGTAKPAHKTIRAKFSPLADTEAQ